MAIVGRTCRRGSLRGLALSMVAALVMALGLISGLGLMDALAEPAVDDGSAIIAAEADTGTGLSAQAATDYGLKVGGVEVTSEMTSGDGWSYAPAEGGSPAQLKLQGFTCALSDGCPIDYQGTEPLEIVVEGDNSAKGSEYGFHSASDGASITIKGGGSIEAVGSDAGISAMGSIVIESGTVKATGDAGKGIWSDSGVEIDDGNVTAAGKLSGISTELSQGGTDGNVVVKGGTVTASGGQSGISSNGNVVVDDGTVTASGDNSQGIKSTGSVEVNGGIVTATGGQAGINAEGEHGSDVVINGGAVTASGKERGVYAKGAVTVNDGTLNATGEQGGIESWGGVTIAGGTVKATGRSDSGIASNSAVVISGGVVVSNGAQAGIAPGDGPVTIGKDVTSLIASGAYGAFYGANAKNAIAGTGWTDVEGTKGKAEIAINTEDDGQVVQQYKKIQFPAVYNVSIRIVPDLGGIVTVDKTTALAGETVTTTAVPNVGYELVGITVTDADHKSIEVEDGAFTMPASDVVVMAEFAEETGRMRDVRPVTLAFDANGGTGTMDKLAAEKGSKVTLPANAFKRDGYTFAGWNTQADGKGTSFADGAEVTLDADVTLYAQWTKSSSKTDDTTASTSDSTSSKKSSLPSTGDPLSLTAIAAIAAAGAGAVLAGRRRRG